MKSGKRGSHLTNIECCEIKERTQGFCRYKCLMELMYALALGAEIHFLLSRISMNQVPVGLVLLDHYEKTRLNKDQIVLME
jgi:hypothetical protein